MIILNTDKIRDEIESGSGDLFFPVRILFRSVGEGRG